MASVGNRFVLFVFWRREAKTDRGKLGVRVVEAESVRGILPKC